jgi:aminotransferase
MTDQTALDAIRSPLSRRARQVGRVASRQTAEAVSARVAAGHEVLKLYGAPFWLPPEHVLDAAAETIHDLDGAPAAGSLALRRAIAATLERDNGFAVDSEREVLVTNAAMHALSLVFTALLDPGDEVLLPSPVFFFDGLIELAGGVPVHVPGREEEGWRWDVAGLAAAVTPSTKLIVVNTPTNPTGYVASREDLETVVALARERDLLILSDEAYETMLYDGAVHHSIAALPGAKERTVSVFSFTKSYALKQWRLGFIAAPAGITAYLLKLLEWNVLACNHVAQRAAQAALEGPQDWVREVPVRYQRYRDLMMAGLAGAPGITFSVPRGAPFLFLGVGGLGVNGEAFSAFLLDEYGVPTDPGRAFHAPDHVRLPFGGYESTITEAAARITHAAHRLAAGRP